MSGCTEKCGSALLFAFALGVVCGIVLAHGIAVVLAWQVPQ